MKTNTKYQISESTCFRSTVNKWPAWSTLISPGVASLHLTNYQIKVLESYLENPEAHVLASQNPELAGGPFVNLSTDRTDDIRTLLFETKKKQAKKIEFAESLKSFANRLATEANGNPLEAYYSEMPPPLRGLVELVYDYFDRPNVRILEGLLYNSELYDVSGQAFNIGKLSKDDSRPFIVNTPCLRLAGEIEWNVTFADHVVDELFRLDTHPSSLDNIEEIIANTNLTVDCLKPFLTEDLSPISPAWKEKRIRLRYFGHACVLVEWNGVSVLTDACVPTVPELGGAERFTFRDLPERIDFVLITHNHHDHYVIDTLLRLRHRIGCLVVPKSHGILFGDVSLKLLSAKLGFSRVIELDNLESVAFDGGEIVGVPFLGEHADLSLGKTGYVVRCGRERILFAADSDCLDSSIYRRISKTIGPVQTAFVSVELDGAPLSWVNGPLLPRQPSPRVDKKRRNHACDSRRALSMIEALESKRTYVYAMGIEPWTEYLLGALTTPDSARWHESELFLSCAQARGVWPAELLRGKTTIFIDEELSPCRPTELDGELPPYWERLRLQARRDGGERDQGELLHLLYNPASVMSIPLAEKDVTQVERGGPFAPSVVLLGSFLVSCFERLVNDSFCLAAVLEPSLICRPVQEPAVVNCVLPLRVDLSGDPSFIELLRRLEKVISSGLDNRLKPDRMNMLTKQILSAAAPGQIRVGFIFSPEVGDDLTHSSLTDTDSFAAVCTVVIVVKVLTFGGYQISLRANSFVTGESIGQDFARQLDVLLGPEHCSWESSIRQIYSIAAELRHKRVESSVPEFLF
jgi:L-ascorbate metabolism protein UlaG (beta-lactamase superfamily)